MEKRVISKVKNDDWNAWADRLGAFGTGFASGYSGQNLANAAQEQSKQTQQLMNQMFGGQGGINTQPQAAASMSQATQPQGNTNYGFWEQMAQRGYNGR